MKSITINELVGQFNLEVLAGRSGLDRRVQTADIHRPGLEFTGYIKYFPIERIQILGRTEIAYLNALDHVQSEHSIEEVVALQPPCFIVTRGQSELEQFILHCDRNEVPLLRTTEKFTYFISLLHNFLERNLAQETTVHGVCLNVFGVGVLLRGPSGIGKSELALTLIERGHRLISDDLVIVKKVHPNHIIGTHNVNNRELLQLRGIGFIDVTRLYGSGAYQDETKIDLDIHLIHWDDYTNIDLLGLERHEIDYLGVSVSQIDIPVRPGRDIALLVEVACKNWRLQTEGYDALRVFEERISEAI